MTMNNGTNTMDISSVLAIIAIVISMISIIIQRKGYRSQLRNDYFRDHFKKALDSELPSLRKNLCFEDEQLKGYQEFQQKLSSIRNGAVFFRYANPLFYRWFKRRNQKVEDYIAKPLNKRYDETRQRQFFRILDWKMYRLYHSITKKYFG